jgi:hypothetical protein
VLGSAHFVFGPWRRGRPTCSGRIRGARVAVEAPPRSQADEDLARAPLEPSLQLERVVARVEDERGDDPFFKPAQQSLDLLGGDLLGGDHIGVLGGPDAR